MWALLVTMTTIQDDSFQILSEIYQLGKNLFLVKRRLWPRSAGKNAGYSRCFVYFL